MTQRQLEYIYMQRLRQLQLYRAYSVQCAKNANRKNSYDKIMKVSDSCFLNYLEYSPKNIDSQRAADYLKSLEPKLGGGGCTGVYDARTGKALRQLDWYYNNEAEFIVKMNADPKKGVFGSIGVTAASPKMTVDVARRVTETNEYCEYFDVLPFFTVDGVNDQGVFAQSNVVNKHGIDININKDDPTKTDCCIVMLVRYILDKFSETDMADAAAVKAKIKGNLHIFGTSKLGGYNSHILVACHRLRKSYVIELTADDVIVNEFPIMTNFRTIKPDLSPIPMTTDYRVDWDEIEQDGIGLERWETCAGFLKQKTGSHDDFVWLRQRLDYAHAYDRPFRENVTWLTDNLSGDLTVADAKECHAGGISREFQEALDGYEEQFRVRSRDTGKTWITTHGAIYDLVNLSCNIRSQMSTGEETGWNVLSDGTISAEPPPEPTAGGIWYVVNGAAEGGWLTKGSILAYDTPSGTWKLGSARILFENAWRGIDGSAAETAFDESFGYAKTLTRNGVTVAVWYESTAGVPTWALGGTWKLDGVVRTTAFVNTADYAFWGNDNYHVRWDKVTRVWSGKRNGRTMRNIDTTLENARQFSYVTSSGGSYTAVWSAS